MTIYAYLILIIAVAIHLFEDCLELLNLRALRRDGQKIPAEFTGFTDAGTLAKTVDYTGTRIRFDMVSSLYDEALFLLFIYIGFLDYYSGWVCSFHRGFIVSGLIFYLILIYGKSLADIPFSLYHTFRIENKYGFNTMNFRMWLSEFFKSTAVSTVLLLIVVSAALWLVRILPDHWWLALWAFFFVFSVFVMVISPYVFEPLFNKFTPVDNDELENKIKAVLSGSGISISRVFKMDASRRTRHSNAYFTGFGHVKRIILYDTLLESLNQDEITAVLAHEAGHWKKKHLLKNLILMETVSFAGSFVAFIMIRSGILADLFGLTVRGNNAFFAQMLLLCFVASLLFWPCGPLFNMISRQFEREADTFACQLMGNGDTLATALVKLCKDNLSNPYPHPLYVFFHYSHPPVLDRIRVLKNFRSTPSPDSPGFVE